MMEAEREGLNRLKRKLSAYRRREKDLVKVFAVLRAEGVEVEKVYEDVVSGRMEVSLDSGRKMEETLTKMRKEDR